MATNTHVVPGLRERLAFLTDAGHLLAASSPETSAYLMRHRFSLLSQYDIPVTDAEKQHVCVGCGSISTPGFGSTLVIDSGIPHLAAKQKAAMRKAARKDKKRTTKAKEDGKQNMKVKANTQSSKPSPLALPGKRQSVGVSKTTTCRRCYTFTKAQLPVPPASLKFKQYRKKVAKVGGTATALKSQPPVAKPQPEPHSANAAFGTPPLAVQAAANKKRKKGKSNSLQALLAGQKKPAAGGFSLADFRMK